MPKRVPEIKSFLKHCQMKDAKKVTIVKKHDKTKFKIRRSRYLYTLTMADKNKAERLTASLPPALTKVEVKSRRKC